MPKHLLVVLVIAVALALGFTYISTRYMNQEEIQQAKMDWARMKSERDSIYAFASAKDVLQGLLKTQVSELQAERSVLRAQRDSLERVRVDQQLGVRRLRKQEELLDKLKEAFPPVKLSMRADSIFDRENNEWLTYFSVPLWFSETFVIEHQNATNYLKQVNKLLLVDSLGKRVDVLKDSVFLLEHQKEEAFRIGYDSAYAQYGVLNEKYIKELSRPRFDLNFPTVGTIIGSAAVGLILGSEIEKHR